MMIYSQPFFHNKHPSSRGFTLIEILVVMLVIGVAATFAMLRFGDFGQTRRMQNTTTELYLLLRTAQQQSILQPAILGWVIKENGFEFYQFIVKRQTGSWQPLSRDRLFGFHAVDNKIFLQLHAENSSPLPETQDQDQTTVIPKLLFLPSGYVTPFTIRIGLRNHSPVYEISGNAAGNIQMQELKSHAK
jgi:general secretion pathway protein H